MASSLACAPLEEMHFLGSALPEPDIREATIGSLECCLSGLLAAENAYLVTFRVTQCEISFFSIVYTSKYPYAQGYMTCCIPIYQIHLY